jgi:hypothetical protein
MPFARKRSWRDWFQEAFVRQGMFSTRPMPTTRAEEAEAAAANKGQHQETTRLNLDSESAPRRHGN